MTGHLLSEDAVEEIPNRPTSGKMTRESANSDVPQMLDVLLAGLHVQINRPQVPTFRMRVDDPLEDRLAPLWITQLVL